MIWRPRRRRCGPPRPTTIEHRRGFACAVAAELRRQGVGAPLGSRGRCVFYQREDGEIGAAGASDYDLKARLFLCGLDDRLVSAPRRSWVDLGALTLTFASPMRDAFRLVCARDELGLVARWFGTLAASRAAGSLDLWFQAGPLQDRLALRVPPSSKGAAHFWTAAAVAANARSRAA